MKIKKEELLVLLKEHLSIHVEGRNFTDPNSRKVKLTWYEDGRHTEIASATFNVVQTREYEG